MAERFLMHDVRWTDESTSRLWDYYSATMPADKYFSYHSGRHIAHRFRKAIPRGASILDFGCGPGYFVGHLLRQFPGCTVQGVDFSAESVRRANAANSRHANFRGAASAAGLPLPFDSGSFDAVFSVEVVEHLNDDQLSGMLLEIRRLLRPGGAFVVTTPHNEDLSATQTMCPECGCTFHLWQHIRSFAADSLGDWLKRAGFECLDVRACRFESPFSALVNRAYSLAGALLGNPTPGLPHLYALARKHA